MKKLFFVLLSVILASSAHAQGRGIKIGYIDMEYILQNVPDYAQANNDLEQKAQKWKQEIETKRNDINKLKESLKTERVLLTKELIEEREEEIAFQEKELLDYQQKRFGPTGDLVTQKSVLIKPIQDQVFNAAQDIADKKKYDFIFDKSSDLTMLFAAKKYDISDQVVRALTRSQRREQMSKKQLKEEEAKEAREDMIDENPALSERQKVLDEKKAAREKLVADRKAAAEAKRQEAQAKRDQLKAEREAKKNGTTPPDSGTAKEESTTGSKDAPKEESRQAAPPSAEEKAAANTEAADAKKAAAEERQRKLDERRKALEEKRKKAQEEREALKKAKLEEREKAKTQTDSVQK